MIDLTRTARLAPFLALALTAAACSTDSSGAETTEVANSSTTSESEATTSTAATATSEPTAEIITLETLAPDTELRTYVGSAMGGIRFEVAATAEVMAIGDMVTIFPEGLPETNTSYRSLSLALVTQAADESLIIRAEHYLAQIESAPEVGMEDTGRAIEVLGYQLSEKVLEELAESRLGFFATGRKGAPVGSVTAQISGRLFIAETPSGILAATMDSDDLEPHLGTVLASLAFTGPGLDPALPVGEFLGWTGDPPPLPAEVSDTGAPALAGAFVPITEGSYQLPNTGLQMEIDIPDGWFIQPHTVGFVVLSKEGSWGPGDRGIKFINGVTEAAALAGGPNEVGERSTFDSFETFAAGLPDGMNIGGVTELDLGGIPATQFDIEVSPDADCTETLPCDFAFFSWGPVEVMKGGNQVRVWWFETDQGPLVAIASAAMGSSYVDNATDVMLSIRSAG